MTVSAYLNAAAKSFLKFFNVFTLGRYPVFFYAFRQVFNFSAFKRRFRDWDKLDIIIGIVADEMVFCIQNCKCFDFTFFKKVRGTIGPPCLRGTRWLLEGYRLWEARSRRPAPSWPWFKVRPYLIWESA